MGHGAVVKMNLPPKHANSFMLSPPRIPHEAQYILRHDQAVKMVLTTCCTIADGRTGRGH